MPKKGYKLTKEHREKVVKNLKPFFKKGHVKNVKEKVVP